MDDEVLGQELKRKKKSFESIINQSRYNEYDLDEVMLEA